MLHVLAQSLPWPRSDTHRKSIDPLASKSHDGRAEFLFSPSLCLTGTCFQPVVTDRRGSPVLPSNEHYSLPISFCIPAISFFKQSPSLLDANCDSTCYNNLGDNSGCVYVCVYNLSGCIHGPVPMGAGVVTCTLGGASSPESASCLQINDSRVLR